MRKNICFFTESYIVGGLDTYIVSLINNWPSEEDHITLMCNESHSGINFLQSAIQRKNFTLKLYSLPLVQEFKNSCNRRLGVGGLSKLVRFVGVYSLFVYYIISVFKKLELKKFNELMVVNGGYPGSRLCQAVSIVWGIGNHKKSIHNFHNYSFPIRKFLFPLEYLIDANIARYSKSLVSVSQSCAASIKQRFGFRNCKKVSYIYNGIPQNITNQIIDIKELFSIPRDHKVCLILASYEERKGHDFLFKVFAKVLKLYPATTLICCGYGETEDMNRIYGLIKSTGIEDNVRVLGYREDAMAILASVDILLISSQSFESFGLTSIEAMKYKKVIVSTNFGGLREVVKNGEGGYTFNIDDVDGYAECIVRLLNSDTLRDEQGKLGYQRFLSLFTVERMAASYYKLLHDEAN
ncbi:MAG: glycosyltransferase family 4 protein [Odoribacter sp.]